jgi:hypothetical protein
MTASPEKQVLDLRREALRAGSRLGRLRHLLAGGIGISLLLLAALLAGLFAGMDDPIERVFAALAAAFTLALPSLALGYLFGAPFAAHCRRLSRQQLRQELRALPAEQRAAALAPLQEEWGDTRDIVAPLLREFQPPTELTPAAAPPGRGSEVAGERGTGAQESGQPPPGCSANSPR